MISLKMCTLFINVETYKVLTRIDNHSKQFADRNSLSEKFEAVYQEYFKSLYLFARSLTHCDEQAKDVVSEVFFKLWKSQTAFTAIRDIKPYLFRSVKNQVIHTLASDPERYELDEVEDQIKQVENINPEEILLEKELVRIIDAAIKSLPDQCQLIFEMAKKDQMSYQEIADELKISKSTIKTQISRAVGVIRNKIELNNRETDSGDFEISDMLGCALFILYPTLFSIEKFAINN